MLNSFQHLLFACTGDKEIPKRYKMSQRGTSCANLYAAAVRNDNRAFAFTLAEVLIILVIIGVIAALTIPNLLTKYEKEQTVTKLKKFYSEFSHTIALAEIDNGPVNTWEFTNPQFTSIDFNNKYIKNYAKSQPTKGYKVKDLQGNNGLGSFTDDGTYSLPDGTTYMLRTANSNNERIFLMVDINGPKKPNIFGKDVFLLMIYRNKKLQMWGYNLTREQLTSTIDYGCNKDVTSGRAGGYCAALIQKDNWEIIDDFPW